MGALIEKFAIFRAELYDLFPFRADATMNLIDAISGNLFARSPVQLCLSALFPRKYSSIHDAVDNFSASKEPETDASEERRERRLERMRVVAEQFPPLVRRAYYLFCVDRTTQPRPFAPTLKERAYQYAPNPAPGNKPITVGHSYSVSAGLPEKTGKSPSPWVLPLLTQRVPPDRKGIDIAAGQVADVLTDESLPFGSHLSVITGDTEYSAHEFLGRMTEHENLVTIARVRGNRVFYQSPRVSVDTKRRGHPVWYGERFDLKNPEARPKPDARGVLPFTFKNGRECRVTLSAWYDMLMQGSRDIPMHKYPFTLLRITATDVDGDNVFANPLWLIIIGGRRRELNLADAYNAYRQRYDIEHFFRFGKNRLLMASYQTPEVEHEENRWEICSLAYVNLYTAASLARGIPSPWERWLPKYKTEPEPDTLPSPSAVRRDLYRIIQEIGTPAQLPKPRGKSPGRQKGESPGRRKRFKIIKKSGREKKMVPSTA